jgi:hypothetical protein
MNAAERSLFAFGIYLLGLGGLLMTAPALVLLPVGLPVPQDVWIRVAGMLVLFLGIYYVVAARSGRPGRRGLDRMGPARRRLRGLAQSCVASAHAELARSAVAVASGGEVDLIGRRRAAEAPEAAVRVAVFLGRVRRAANPRAAP